MNIPKSLNNDKIAEAICELRFETTYDSSLILGLFFSVVKEQYPNIDTLPSINIPEDVRRMDSNLAYLPTHRLKDKDNRFYLQLGSKAVTVIAKKPYSGWKMFKAEIEKVLGILKTQNIVSSYTQLGLKYIDFFDDNILDISTININVYNKPIKDEPSNINVTLNFENDITTNIQVANKAEIQFAESDEIFRGSLLSIDNIITKPESLTPSNIETSIERAHDLQKELFFKKIIKEEYWAKLDPQY